VQKANGADIAMIAVSSFPLYPTGDLPRVEWQRVHQREAVRNMISRKMTLSALLGGLWILAAGCGDESEISVRLLEDQIERQLRNSDDVPERPDAVRIVRFRPGTNGVIAQIEVQWDRRTTSNADVPFATIAQDYALGTLDLPELDQPINLILHFD